MPKSKDKPTAANFGQFRSRCAQLGIKQAELDAAVGTKVNGRGWKQIADALILWLRDRPKA